MPSYALDIYLNNSLAARYDNSELEARLRAHPDGTYGVTLLELSPLLFSCDSVIVKGDREQMQWTSRNAGSTDDYANVFHNMVILSDGDSWSFIFEEHRIETIDEIRLEGDILDDESLEVWVGWEGTSELGAIIRSFGAYHEIDIDVVEVANIRTKLLTVFRAGGKVPDVVMVQADYLPVFTSLDLLQPVDVVVEATPDLRQPDAFHTAERLWAIPFYFDAQLIVFQPDMVSPSVDGRWTLDEFEKTLEVLAEVHEAPASWNVYSAYWLTPFLFAFGKETLADADGMVNIDDAATIEAIEYQVELHETGLLDSLERDAMLGRFLRGESGLVLTGSYSIPMLEKVGVPYGVAPLPVELRPIHDYKGFSITRRSRHSPLARRVIQYLSSTGVQHEFCKALSKFPARESAFAAGGENDGSPVDAKQRALLAAAERGVPVPPTAGYTKYKNTLWQLLRLVFSKKISVTEALEEGQRIISGGNR